MQNLPSLLSSGIASSFIKVFSPSLPSSVLVIAFRCLRQHTSSFQDLSSKGIAMTHRRQVSSSRYLRLKSMKAGELNMRSNAIFVLHHITYG